jgi:transposase
MPSPAAAAVTSRDARELCGWFAPHLDGLQVERVSCSDAGVVIEARPRTAGAVCPACGVWSSQVHSGYVRTVQDGPAGGRPVLIRLAVRRFLCRNPGCPAVTFAEQAEGVSARYRRRSVPLLGLLAQIGLALAGRAGARLAAVLGIAVHRTTLLGLVAALPEPCLSTAPEVTGVDDFALRKGRSMAPCWST